MRVMKNHEGVALVDPHTKGVSTMWALAQAKPSWAVVQKLHFDGAGSSFQEELGSGLGPGGMTRV